MNVHWILGSELQPSSDAGIQQSCGCTVYLSATITLTEFSHCVYSASGASVVAIDNKIEQAMVSKI